MADPRFEKINELFINYSLGDFDYKIDLSPKLDEIDAFISNINMLGEELKATTISKNYFNNIFNSVSDIIFFTSAIITVLIVVALIKKEQSDYLKLFLFCGIVEDPTCFLSKNSPISAISLL